MDLIDDLSLILESKFTEAYLNFMKRYNSNIKFSLTVDLGDSALIGLYNRFLTHIKTKIADEGLKNTQIDLKKEIITSTSLGKELGEETIDDIIKYNTIEQELENEGKPFHTIIYEKCYVDIYQAFEQYIFDCFKNIYMICPKFLFKSQPMNLYYDDIFDNDNIEICREKLIDRKVKGIIQSNNINTILLTFNKEFELKLKIPHQEQIFIISKNRNVLTHNNGIINTIYIEELKKNKIISKYNINDSLLDNIYEEKEEAVSIVGNVAKYLYESINPKHISNYYCHNVFL